MSFFAKKFHQNRLSLPNKNNLQEYYLWKKTIANEDLPLALIDLAAFDDNLKKLKDMVKNTNKTIRIATKSIRIPALIQRALQNGLPFKGLMCYSVREVSFLQTLFRHAKAGELAEHFNEVLLVNKDKSTYHARTYRGFHQSFL